ncbi:MAG TPA: hypothetical protein VKU41_17930 [Polyangiaceae bacterium]|nr:hypothetical protein [Polyangiaceae bacterium]
MKSMECTKAGLTAIVAVASLVPRLAYAQPTGAQPPLPPPPPPPPATTAASTPLPPSPAPPPAPDPESRAQPAEEVPDHERFVGHIGVTYFDIASLPVANPVATAGAFAPAAAGITSSTVSAPVVGVRYWFHRDFGVDVGIGAGYAGGSQETVTGAADNSADKASTGGFAFHGGLPIAFFHGKHYTFLLIPQFTVGVTTGSFTPTGGIGQDLSGFLFDGGAAIGAEIHFGFIGIPELALQATVGLSYRRTVFKWKSGNNSFSDGTNTFGTNVSADPWAIFKDTISATYYF